MSWKEKKMKKDLLKTRQDGISLDKPVFPISVVADILEVHQRTLRIYNEEGILIPARSPKNRRLYSVNDIEKGKFIQYLSRELGINIIGIKIILEFLKEKNVNSEEYRQYIELIAQRLNITEEVQKKNREKLSKRGRKPAQKV